MTHSSKGAFRAWATVQTVLIVMLLVSVGYLGYLALRTHEALCSLRADIQADYDRSTAYVRKIEEGNVPLIPGFTLVELRDDLAAQKSRLDALDGLDC